MFWPQDLPMRAVKGQDLGIIDWAQKRNGWK
jgi:hypothetical protein